MNNHLVKQYRHYYCSLLLYSHFGETESNATNATADELITHSHSQQFYYIIRYIHLYKYRNLK